jgi:hypothetical protein
MIIRQGINAAVHLAGGALLGLLAVFATRELARAAKAHRAKTKGADVAAG